MGMQSGQQVGHMGQTDFQQGKNLTGMQPGGYMGQTGVQ